MIRLPGAAILGAIETVLSHCMQNEDVNVKCELSSNTVVTAKPLIVDSRLKTGAEPKFISQFCARLQQSINDDGADAAGNSDDE